MPYIKDGSYHSDECCKKERDCCYSTQYSMPWQKTSDCECTSHCTPKEKDCCHASQHPMPKQVLLECGCNPQCAIFKICNDRIQDNQCFTLDTVVVDTTCLRRPLVKLDFSSIVFFEAESNNSCQQKIEVDLLFELVRICDCHRDTLQCWRYLEEIEVRSDNLEVKSSKPFTVTFCDKPCPGCCEYKMLVHGKCFEGAFDALRIVSPNLCALAQGICD